MQNRLPVKTDQVSVLAQCRMIIEKAGNGAPMRLGHSLDSQFRRPVANRMPTQNRPDGVALGSPIGI